VVERHALCGSVLEKIPQEDDEKKRAQVCIDILFQPKKTEHYGSCIRCEHGTKMNFEKLPILQFHWLF
jgi:hypothetical protein